MWGGGDFFFPEPEDEMGMVKSNLNCQNFWNIGKGHRTKKKKGGGLLGSRFSLPAPPTPGPRERLGSPSRGLGFK